MKKFRVKSRKVSFEKKLLFGLLVLGISLFMGSTAVAGTITLAKGTYQSGNGGEFFATNMGVPDVPATFNTFCIERTETFNYGTPYDATVNTVAVNGGVGGGSPDPLSFATAWLYTQYLDGFSAFTSETGYIGYGTLTINSVYEAGELQNAIWALEDEISPPGSSNLYYALATDPTKMTWTDIGNVRVLNLTKTDATGKLTLHQDVLTVVPIPGAVWLLGSGLLGLAGIRMRSRRNSV